jgi:hypothetical protein
MMVYEDYEFKARLGVLKNRLYLIGKLGLMVNIDLIKLPKLGFILMLESIQKKSEWKMNLQRQCRNEPMNS